MSEELNSNEGKQYEEAKHGGCGGERKDYMCVY